MSFSQKKIDAILSLPGEDRYKHFVKVVVDTEQAWGLYQDGWAMASTDDDQLVFLLWPAEEYARLCAVNEWKNYQAKPITLQDLMQSLLPKLKQKEELPGIFYTPSGKGVTPTIEGIEESLKEEMSKY